jgi:ATP-dependent HslUV protease subunit HslV
MSTIVVVKKNGKAVIAADSRTMYNEGTISCDARYDHHYDKIHKVNDAFVGIVGNSAHHSAFASIVEKHPGDFSFNNRRHVFETALKLHRKLKAEYHLLTNENDTDQPYESSQIDALIAAPSGIFGLFSYRQVEEYTRFWAIGSGSRFALGAMYAVYDQIEDAQVIAEIGIKAAAEFDNCSALPLTSHSVQLATAK